MSATGSRLAGAAVPNVAAPRAHWLDAARGIAVVAMVIYHGAWNLSHFGAIEVDVANHPGWRLFAKAIAASFLLLAGYALVLAHGDGIRWRAFLKRLGIIAGSAALVTAATLLSFPDSFIFFGILHSIALGSVLALAFLRWPWWALTAVAAFVFFLPDFYRADVFASPLLLWTGLGTSVPPTNDYEPIFPWFAYMLAGMALARARLPMLQQATGADAPLLEWLGRWSLVIYLAHQPVLFGLTLGAFRMGWL